jgi:hypothetical protein
VQERLVRKLALELLLRPNVVEPLMRQLFVQGLVSLPDVAGKSLNAATSSVILAKEVADAAHDFRVSTLAQFGVVYE